MILSLAGRYRKVIAGFFGGIFCLQLVVPLTARAEPVVFYVPKKSSTVAFPFEIATEAIVTDKSSLHPFIQGSQVANTLLKQPAQRLNVEKEMPEKPEKPDIGGPGQPEMSSFQSVNGNNMVDLFSGDFSYNIPLMDVGGYPVNIHYSSGITMDQEASWVGLGFNINPGTINRNMRGLPDDFNGTDSITKTQNIKRNKTTGVKVGIQAELVGLPLTIGAGSGVFHNNYNGWGIEQV